jgi:hypothetical protein
MGASRSFRVVDHPKAEASGGEADQIDDPGLVPSRATEPNLDFQLRGVRLDEMVMHRDVEDVVVLL